MCVWLCVCSYVVWVVPKDLKKKDFPPAIMKDDGKALLPRQSNHQRLHVLPVCLPPRLDVAFLWPVTCFTLSLGSVNTGLVLIWGQDAYVKKPVKYGGLLWRQVMAQSQVLPEEPLHASGIVNIVPEACPQDMRSVVARNEAARES
jgi:hypothetical protein